MKPFLLSAAFAAALVAATPALPQMSAGAYLAGRQAAMRNDFDAAARYFTEALAADPSNAELLEDTMNSRVLLGDVAGAAPIATRLEEMGQRSQIAHMVTVAEAAKAGAFAEILTRDIEARSIGPLVDGLVQAWAQIGTGDIGGGLARFDAVAPSQGLGGFALYHKAMALAYLGEFEAAEAIFGDDGAGAMTRTRRAAMARAEVLSQLGRNADAIASLRDAFGPASDPELAVLTEALSEGGPVPFTHVTSPLDGVAEVFFSVAGALRSEAGESYTLLYGRIARYLRPDHMDALLMNAELLEGLRQFDLAINVYAQVPSEHPAFHAAELGRAAALRRADRPDAAIEVLERLSRDFSDLPVVFSSLGDALRSQEQYAAAIPAYNRALELTESGARAEWFLYYARAISFEREGRWNEAEADFRRALELNPGQPQVLNYLGYSLVEKQIKLDEALAMIEEAVAASPDSGYIVDSLGWVLYRLGRYEEAVVHMERAVELMPVDPVVNDHLGDVYWAVGREREAMFQWKRALSFVDLENVSDDADPDRIRRKIEVGLDVVLEEEGASPLQNGDDI
ncbi:MAG: tetratricopeptide repeat protein [Pseudomonadota bacterium]